MFLSTPSAQQILLVYIQKKESYQMVIPLKTLTFFSFHQASSKNVRSNHFSFFTYCSYITFNTYFSNVFQFNVYLVEIIIYTFPTLFRLYLLCLISVLIAPKALLFAVHFPLHNKLITAIIIIIILYIKLFLFRCRFFYLSIPFATSPL